MRVPSCILCVILIVLANNLLYAQNDVMLYYNKEFSFLNSAYILRNPAFVENNHKAIIKLGYNGFNRLSTNLKSVYFLANFRISNEEKRICHHVGLSVVNFQEGKYLNQNIAHFRYSQVFFLGPNTSINTGFATGLYNQTIESNNVTGGASSFTPDGCVGLKFAHKSIYTGLSVSQIFNSKFVSFDKAAQLVRVYYFNLGNKFKLDLNEMLTLDAELVIKSPDEFKSIFAYAYGNLTIKEVFQMNVLLNDVQAFNFGIGFPKIPIQNHEFGFGFCYTTRFLSQNYTNIGNIEASLTYRVK